MAVEMIGGPRLCEPLLATGLGRFTGCLYRTGRIARLAGRSGNGWRVRARRWRALA
jgi:hypothetical protein